MIRRTLYAMLLAVFLLVGVAAWYLFRPEKAFIDDVVDEPFPGEVSPGAALAPHSILRPSAPEALGRSIDASLSRVSFQGGVIQNRESIGLSV
jgi:hypothetical protein